VIRPIRGVLFDKDGTLFDFTATWRGAAEAVLAALAPTDPALRRRMGLAVGFDPDTGLFCAGSAVVAGSTTDIAAALSPFLPGLHPAEIEGMANAAAHAIGLGALAPAAPDLPGLLDGLRAEGRTLGVATHDGEAAARRHLAAVGALDRFAFIAGYDSGHGLKPGPGMVLAFAEAAGLAPAEICMIGDSLHDLHAGRAAGAALTIAVLTGPATEEELSPHADAVLPSIAALPAFFAARRL
jgi:phosphoglycolate phosphatase